MARTIDEYLQLFQSLLPKGKFWNRNVDSVLAQLLKGKADEFIRIEERLEDLLLEVSTKTATELLTEHEEDFGLPEDGQTLAATTAQRRLDLNAKKVAVGQQDKQYFIDIATALGYTTTITEFTPAWVGVTTVGMTVGNGSVMFYFLMNVLIEDGIIIDITNLRDQINKYKPGHTVALFDFVGPPFNRAFDRSFDSIPFYDGTIRPGAFDSMFSIDFAVNNYYDGVYLTGAFNTAFGIGFDRRSGGAFEFNEFGNSFTKPS